MPIGLKGNTDGSGAVQIGGSDAISISTGLNTTFAGTITATGTVAGTTGTLYPLVSDTVRNATGTSVDFTGIPSWVRRVTVMFNNVSTNGTSIPQIQLGSGSFTTSGYVGSASIAANASSPAVINMASGFLISAANAATYSFRGAITINLISTQVWVASGVVGQDDSARISWSGGAVGIAGTLDRVRITTVSGADSFDAGTINILFE